MLTGMVTGLNNKGNPCGDQWSNDAAGLAIAKEDIDHDDIWYVCIQPVPLAIILPLAMLPSIKGMVVVIQWATGMHGLADPPN